MQFNEAFFKFEKFIQTQPLECQVSEIVYSTNSTDLLISSDEEGFFYLTLEVLKPGSYYFTLKASIEGAKSLAIVNNVLNVFSNQTEEESEPV